MKKELNIVIAGLSGQGIVMMGRVLSTALLADGENVIISDSLAIMHRNSPTYTNIRVGDEIYSLKIAEGEADLVVALEAIEGLKLGITYARDDGLIILNDRVIKQRVSVDQPGVGAAKTSPLTEILQCFDRAEFRNVMVFRGSDVAQNDMGRLLTLNMVMLGAAVATGMIPVQPRTVEDAIEKLSPKPAVEINGKAFKAGMERFKEQLRMEPVIPKT